MGERDTSTAEPYRPPQHLQSEDERFAQAIDTVVVKALKRPAIRAALLDLIRDGIHRGTFRLEGLMEKRP